MGEILVELALKLLLTWDSAKRSQQTLTLHLGLPGHTGIFPTMEANTPPGAGQLTAPHVSSPECPRNVITILMQ